MTLHLLLLQLLADKGGTLVLQVESCFAGIAFAVFTPSLVIVRVMLGTLLPGGGGSTS